MAHHHERSRAGLGDMHIDAVRRDGAMANFHLLLLQPLVHRSAPRARHNRRNRVTKCGGWPAPGGRARARGSCATRTGGGRVPSPASLRATCAPIFKHRHPHALVVRRHGMIGSVTRSARSMPSSRGALMAPDPALAQLVRPRVSDLQPAHVICCGA